MAKTLRIAMRRGTDIVWTELPIEDGVTKAELIEKAAKIAESSSGGYTGWTEHISYEKKDPNRI